MKYENHAKWLFEVATEYLSGKCDDYKFEIIVKTVYKKVDGEDEMSNDG